MCTKWDRKYEKWKRESRKGSFLLEDSRSLKIKEQKMLIILYNNEIDDDSIDAFCEMLETKRKLRILGLEYNKIRNKAEHVMRAIQNKPIFERLYLT